MDRVVQYSGKDGGERRIAEGNSGVKRAVVLLSGGVDSATTLAVARSDGFETHALSVDYGQRHRRELECAARVAASLGAASHKVVTLDLRAIGGSALTAALEVPKDRPYETMPEGIPITYVPARNTVLLGLALVPLILGVVVASRRRRCPKCKDLTIQIGGRGLPHCGRCGAAFDGSEARS